MSTPLPDDPPPTIDLRKQPKATPKIAVQPDADESANAARPSTPSEMSRYEVIRLAREYQRQNWEKGEPILVEAYLEELERLKVDAEGILDLVYNEWVLREEAGQSPELDEYLQRFPQY